MDSALPSDPYRHERHLLTVGSVALCVLGAIGFPSIAHDYRAWFPAFLLWSGWLVGVPAGAIARRFGASATPLERAAFSGTLSLVGLALFQFFSLELGVRGLILAYPAVVVVLMRCVKDRGTTLWNRPRERVGGARHPRADARGSTEPGGWGGSPTVAPMPRLAMLGGVLAFAMALGVMTASPTFFPARAPVADPHGRSRCLKLLPDILLHLQAQEEMSHTWPPQFSPAAGVPLRYHLAADALTLALTPPGVPRLPVNCRYMPALWHLIVALNALVLARRYLGPTWLAGLFPILAVFGEDFGWVVPQLELPMVPTLPTFPSFFWYNPNLPGLAVLLGGLGALGWATDPLARSASEGSSCSPSLTLRANNFHLAAAVLLLGGAALFKVFIGVQAGLAVGLSLLLVGAESRRGLAKVVVGLGLFGVLLAFLYRHTFESPNQHLQFELLSEMRASVWFVPVILGFRVLGLWELIRIPLAARSEGPLRVVVACFVATGMIGLIMRISARQMTGELGYNNGVWLAVVAKVPMWLLVLGALQRWRIGNAGRGVLATTITAVALWGSVPYLKLIRSPEAVAPHRLGPDDLEIPRWLERSTPPGAVIACDASFPLNLTALTACRTPCPHGAEFAYSISFMTVAEQGRRVADAEQFWGEWFCGGLPRKYLANYDVRWVIARGELAFPEGAREVFRNGSWAIYEAIPLNSETASAR